MKRLLSRTLTSAALVLVTFTAAQADNQNRSQSPFPSASEEHHWNLEALMALRVLIAAALGGFVGWERERHGREAGVRTYGAVALGACVFALISTHITGGNNPHVIAAGVVTGVGFLGAGVIMKDNGSIVGLTTAASLWATASVGLAVGYGMYTLGVLVSLIVFGLLSLHHAPGWLRLKGEPKHPSKETVDRVRVARPESKS